jgi:hypothetical protein
MAMRSTGLAYATVNVLLVLITLLSCLTAANATTGLDGSPTGTEKEVALDDDRQPALYIQSFGDCMGGSLLDITRFDAAYYKDNMTIMFHLQGSSLVTGVPLILRIGVYAYGEDRFSLLFNPCNTNMAGLCPTNSSVPVDASGIIPVSADDVAGIIPIALTIPDFEGQATLRIFSNATESEIACYSAVVTNGNTFSHANVIGPIVGIFVFAALVASFLTLTYGEEVSTIRTHYAHSMSVFVVFSVLQHIYFTGALSVNWPSVLPAFWSNFAWASGMIYSKQMMNSINRLLGVNLGNTSVVGAAAQGASDNTAGGYKISEVYKRAYGLPDHMFGRAPASYSGLVDGAAFEHHTPRHLVKRAIENSSSAFNWYGSPVHLGLPLPGNYSGFPGTLAGEGIPASNAFLTGLLWFLIVLVLLLASVVSVKWISELLVRLGCFKKDRLSLFRQHWVGYGALVAARTFFIGFFMLMFLSIFQFVYKGSEGVYAVAACIFIFFFLGLFGIATLACLYRIRVGDYTLEPDRIHLGRTYVFGRVPWYGFRRQHLREKERAPPSIASIPWWRYEDHSPTPQRDTVHEDEAFIKRYGWLSARYRRTKWWFFTAWLAYEFVRACFYGGAANHPRTQVYGLLVVEVLASILLASVKPFEGNRLNALMVYLLGISKITCVALSATFIADYGLPRIVTTAIGIVIIVIQSFLVLAMIVLIILGAVSTRMSMTRNREVDPHSEDWAKLRNRYFSRLSMVVQDREKIKPTAPQRTTTAKDSAASRFSVHTIHRMPKIEDHEEHKHHEAETTSSTSVAAGQVRPTAPTHSRGYSIASSMHSTRSYSGLPFGARPHRASWSSRDVQSLQETQRGSKYATPNASRASLQNVASDDSPRDGYQVQACNRPLSRPPPRPQTNLLKVTKSRASIAESGDGLKMMSSAAEEGAKTQGKENEIGVAL